MSPPYDHRRPASDPASSRGRLPRDRIPEFYRDAPGDDDLDGYLLSDELSDAARTQSYSAPTLPTIEEVEVAIALAESLLDPQCNEVTAAQQLKPTFEKLVLLLAHVERDFFERPCFGESPFERLKRTSSGAQRIVSDLASTQMLIRELCSRDPELVTHQFFTVVLFHLQRTTHNTASGQHVVVLDDQTPQNTFKDLVQLREDCSLATDQLIRGAGFTCSLPAPNSVEPVFDSDGKPVPLEETPDGLELLREESSRQGYILRRDAPDVPAIDLGPLPNGIGLQHVELVADALKHVAIAELVAIEQYGFDMAMRLSMAEVRASELRVQMQTYCCLSETATRVAETLSDSGASSDLTGLARRAFGRMRDTDLRFSERVISDESVAVAKAELERSEQIRFTATRLLARDEHPAIKYAGDAIAKEIAAIEIATQLIDSGEHPPKLRSSDNERSESPDT